MMATLLDQTPTTVNKLVDSLPFTLTPQQQQALAKLRAFLISPSTFFLLCGYAGTGKSTIVFQIVKELIAEGTRVVLSAPTNKAVGILKKMAAENGIDTIPCITVHQLLGLGEKLANVTPGAI
ncbi:MAG: AAA family ATPase [Symploca sp. SIO3C6]|uniref:AAA family ATPase n=1 Tax=Symploca sp. SIO1C4 TaxID=2607765 RepID=A0A6B3NHV9_9CYAN|nr:AAA family ATPase [Symploca sp. SIO3C6]NER30445.1 AAA family ATPase [Symploca sp. SIO1C4]